MVVIYTVNSFKTAIGYTIAAIA